jgi:hypothetical protein
MKITNSLLQYENDPTNMKRSKLSGDDLAEFKHEILEWVKLKGRAPLYRGENDVEHLYGRRLTGYISLNSTGYDPIFAERYYMALGRERKPRAKEIHRANAEQIVRRKKAVLIWVSRNKRPPSLKFPMSKLERRFAQYTAYYVSPSQDCFDYKFAMLYHDLLGNQKKVDRALQYGYERESA